MRAYVLFLRGINVGGNSAVSMRKLETLLKSMGLTKVKTFLNSGNITFESEKSRAELKRRLVAELYKEFGLKASAFIYGSDEIKSLVESDPFKKITVKPNTRLYVTFLGGRQKSAIKLPYKSPHSEFTLLFIDGSMVCSVLSLSKTTGTPDLMQFLEIEFGKNVTTRSFSTLRKIRDSFEDPDRT